MVRDSLAALPPFEELRAPELGRKALMFDDLVDIAAGAVAVPAGMLPKRHWRRFPSLPIERLVLISAVLTILGGFVIGVQGFRAYSERVGRQAAAMTIRVAELQNQGKLPNDPKINFGPIVLSALSPLAFALFTPLGLLATYLIASGVARALSVIVEDPFGDPILTGVDAAVLRATTRARHRRRRAAREQQEGPEVPDRLYTGASAGLPDVDFVVVASREKPDWDRGTFVITDDKWYVVGTPFDLRVPDGLRTIYPLTEQKTLDVLRRGVRYELPPLRPGMLRASGRQSDYNQR